MDSTSTHSKIYDLDQKKLRTPGTPPLVTVAMASYNNVQYLEQAVQSCLAQKTSFPFEILIADDASTDGSQELIQKLAAAHPQIRVSQQKKNCIEKNYAEMFQRIKSKYIAFCDGDDFWLDPDKLEMQVRFLEENPNFTVAAHKTDVLIEGRVDSVQPKPIYKRNASRRTKEEGVLYADEVADNYYLHTSSYVFRWLFPEGLPPYWKNFMANDHFLLLLHAAEGKIKYFDRTMSVWRRHDNGYTWLQTQKPAAYIREKWDQYVELQIKMDAFFEGRFHYQLMERVRFALQGIVSECLAAGDLPMLDFIVSRYPQYFNEIDKKYTPILDGLRLIRPVIRPTAFSLKKDAVSPVNNKPSPIRPIGGAVPLDIAAIHPVAGSVWEAWTAGKEVTCVHNATSALAKLLWQESVQRLWIPFFCDNKLLTMLQHMEFPFIYYDISDTCEYLPYFLQQVRPGDAVLTPCFFGAPLPGAMQDALATRQDIIWIEDRSLALDAGVSSAPWQIYSPPTVLGVPDGGLIVGKGVSEWSLPPMPDNEDILRQRLSPCLLNLEFPDRAFLRGTAPMEEDNLYDFSNERMSTFSRNLLERLPAQPLIKARKRNWSILWHKLSHLALWNIPEPTFAPASFPLMLPKGKAASRLMSFLGEQGVLCQVPYGNARERLRSEALFTRFCALPCDHHYSENDMERLADTVLRLEKNLWK